MGDEARCDDHPDADTRLLKRATEAAGWPDAWRTAQVVECQRCGAAWSV